MGGPPRRVVARGRSWRSAAVSWIEALDPSVRVAFWTILVASLCSVMCAWLGVWLVLQRLSMTGDAISHAVLPGLVLTFVWFGTRDAGAMMVGAAVAGLVTVALTKGLSQLVGVREDASLGVVFTVLFALGVILVTRFAGQIDLDPGCVLYGLVEFVALDTRPLWGTEVPTALFTLVPAFALVCAFLFALNGEIKLMAFDPGLARVLGKRPGVVYYVLMAFVALATVASFEAVGSILVIAMLIGPPAAAQLVTRDLRAMFALSALFAVLASMAGYLFAARLNTSVAGMIAVSIGALYAGCAFVFLVRGRPTRTAVRS